MTSQPQQMANPASMDTADSLHQFGQSGMSNTSPQTLSGVFANSGLRALVVDDYPMNRLALVSILDRMGILTESAENGALALALLKDQPFDLCLMDVHMPSLSGIEATWSLRLSKDWATPAEIPVIGISANTGDKDKQACLEAGMNECLGKPLQPELLAETIRSLTDEHRSDSPASKKTSSQESSDTVFWDLDDLLDRIMGNRELALTLRDGFIFDVPRQMARLRESFGHNDHENTLMHAHRIKGAAACVGANRLSEAASDLETASRDGDQTAARTAFFRLEWIFDQTLQALESSRNDP